jgi:hypothetical protein
MTTSLTWQDRETGKKRRWGRRIKKGDVAGQIWAEESSGSQQGARRRRRGGRVEMLA